jgi:hypothetical protein
MLCNKIQIRQFCENRFVHEALFVGQDAMVLSVVVVSPTGITEMEHCWDRGTEAQRHRGTEAQRHRGTEAQRHRGTEAQRRRGIR